MTGLLFINDTDVYEACGAFLSEDRAGATENYSALLKPPAMKPYISVDFREDTGEKLPDILLPVPEARDITLQFSIIAPTKFSFFESRKKFLKMLRSGWLNIYLPELGETFRVYYLSCQEYTQLTTFQSGDIGGKFKVKFREPKPKFE